MMENPSFTKKNDKNDLSKQVTGSLFVGLVFTGHFRTMFYYYWTVCVYSTQQIKEEISQLTFEELLRLKDELGTKVYADTVLCKQQCSESIAEKREKSENRCNSHKIKIMKRLNHNQPREESSKRAVPFMGAEQRKHKCKSVELRDPRFDERAGEYNAKVFKTNYKFLTEVREKEIEQLKEHLKHCSEPEKQIQLRKAIQKLNNKNVEERKWHHKQFMLRKEKDTVQQAKQEGKKPQYITKGL